MYFVNRMSLTVSLMVALFSLALAATASAAPVRALDAINALEQTGNMTGSSIKMTGHFFSGGAPTGRPCEAEIAIGYLPVGSLLLAPVRLLNPRTARVRIADTTGGGSQTRFDTAVVENQDLAMSIDLSYPLPSGRLRLVQDYGKIGLGKSFLSIQSGAGGITGVTARETGRPLSRLRPMANVACIAP